jgi:hypothetical protein
MVALLHRLLLITSDLFAGEVVGRPPGAARVFHERSLHAFEVAGLPALVEGCFCWAIEA